jgi:hypothetical protein
MMPGGFLPAIQSRAAARSRRENTNDAATPFVAGSLPWSGSLRRSVCSLSVPTAC